MANRGGIPAGGASAGALGASMALRFALLVLLLLPLCTYPTQAATVTDLKNTIITALQGIESGMTDFYSYFGAVPAVEQQYCTTAITNQAPGLSLTMEALFSPYGVLATPLGLLIYRDNYLFGPSFQLIGASAFTNGTLTTNVQTGTNNILVPYERNTIVFVTGTMTSLDGRVNMLPMARYMIVDGFLCSYLNMNVSSLYSGIMKTPLAALA